MGGDGGVIAVKREFVRGCRNKNEEEAKVIIPNECIQCTPLMNEYIV